MAKFKYKYFECDTGDDARQLLKAEVANWTWLSEEAKANVVKNAIVKRSETRFGPVYQVAF